LWLFGGANGVCGNGYVTTNGTAVFLATKNSGGWQFPLGGQLNGQLITFAGKTYTIASVQDANNLTLTTSAGVQTTPTQFYLLSGTEAHPRYDMYYLSLNSNPMLNTWKQVFPRHFPIVNSNAALVYDPDDDVLFALGYDGGASTHDNWVYCPTNVNPTPGVLTAKQSAAGCASGDDWTEVAP